MIEALPTYTYLWTQHNTSNQPQDNYVCNQTENEQPTRFHYFSISLPLAKK